MRTSHRNLIKYSGALPRFCAVWRCRSSSTRQHDSMDDRSNEQRCAGESFDTPHPGSTARSVRRNRGGSADPNSGESFDTPHPGSTARSVRRNRVGSADPNSPETVSLFQVNIFDDNNDPHVNRNAMKDDRATALLLVRQQRRRTIGMSFGTSTPHARCTSSGSTTMHSACTTRAGHARSCGPCIVPPPTRRARRTDGAHAMHTSGATQCADWRRRACGGLPYACNCLSTGASLRRSGLRKSNARRAISSQLCTRAL